MNGTTVFFTAIAYVSLLFLIAWWGDRGGRRFASGGPRAVVYALSLAVYCTSWTYYGSVGLASEHGLDFLCPSTLARSSSSASARRLSGGSRNLRARKT